MSEALDSLVRLLDLETIEVNVYRGIHPAQVRQRTFGGQVAAQALMAAGRTVSGTRVHSLHSYFLRPGDTSIPILYEVDTIRDGKSFTTRRVVAIQHGKAIYNMQASFHNAEVGVEHQIAMPDVPAPETIPSVLERLHREVDDDRDGAESFQHGKASSHNVELQEYLDRQHPIDQRYIGELPWSRTRSTDPYQRLWIKADGDLPDDPLLHACVVTYASDMSLLTAVLKPHALRWDDEDFMVASLDHCMWFHGDLRADEWLLYDTESPIATAGRGLARGFLFSRDGELKVSMVQEGLTRKTSPTYKKA
ncbi:MAG: Acyl-CoA thioesterase [Acidimicrobiaceae bacterium]|nr:Acyl-CoA thioesterase [Acidimicrobiaceae bacterium]